MLSECERETEVIANCQIVGIKSVESCNLFHLYTILTAGCWNCLTECARTVRLEQATRLTGIDCLNGREQAVIQSPVCILE